MFPQVGVGFQFEQVFVYFVLKVSFGLQSHPIGLTPQFHSNGFPRLSRLFNLFPELFEREETFCIVRPHFDMFRFSQESHDFRAEFFNTGSGEYIVRKTDLSEEREHGFHLAYLSLVPKFVEHEGVGNNDQHQSSRIQQIVGFPAKIELRRAAIEVEIVGRITEQQVEAKAGIVVSQVASFDMGRG